MNLLVVAQLLSLAAPYRSEEMSTNAVINRMTRSRQVVPAAATSLLEASSAAKLETQVAVRAQQSARLMTKRRQRQLARQPEAPCAPSVDCKGTCFVDVESAGYAFKMKIFEQDEFVSRVPLCEGRVWEWDTVAWMIDQVKTARRGNFLDVGANIGSFSLPFAAWMRERGHGRVVAVDADDQVMSLLQESATESELDGVVLSTPLALVSNSSQERACLLQKDAFQSNNPGGQQVSYGDRNFCERQVASTTLDELYSARPELLGSLLAAKLDCEGCEGQALRGAKKLLLESPPCLLAFEVTEEYLCEAQTPLKELYDFLEEAGYDTIADSVRPKGDGTCASWRAWSQQAENAAEAEVQGLTVVRQRDFDTCMARFA